MRKYITTYMKKVDEALADKDTDLELLKEEHIRQIGFIQHERLVHLLVTIMCCILLFLCMGVFFICGIKAFLAVAALLLILSLSYLLYYFFIENAVQAMYGQHDEITSRLHGDDIAGRLMDKNNMIRIRRK
ncbi:MAG: hypothetical protein IJ080_09040 [Oscillospiraceae bacterium]|nr:hypothetical protein [Oscillospiraceae bacterium]